MSAQDEKKSLTRAEELYRDRAGKFSAFSHLGPRELLGIICELESRVERLEADLAVVSRPAPKATMVDLREPIVYGPTMTDRRDHLKPLAIKEP